MIGVDFKVKTIVLDNKRVKLSIWVSTVQPYNGIVLKRIVKDSLPLITAQRIQLDRNDSELSLLATTGGHRESFLCMM